MSERKAGSGQQRGHGGSGGSNGGAAPVQWLAAAVGALLVLGTLGFLLYEHWAVPDTPPAFAFAVDSTRAVPTGTTLFVTVHNTGRRTAADVQVEVRAGSHLASAVLDYLPGRGRRQVSFEVPGATAGADVQLRVGGYTYP